MIKPKHQWILEEIKQLKTIGKVSAPRSRDNKGYANFPIKWSVTGHFKDYGIKENGVELRAFFGYTVNKDYGGIVLIDNDRRKELRENAIKKTLTDPKYITNRKNITDEYAHQMMDFANKKLNKENILKASKKELMEYYNQFRDIYMKFEFYSGIWFFISDDLAKIVVDQLESEGCTDFHEIQILTTPTFQSFVNKETIDLLSLALHLQKDEKAKNMLIEGNFEQFAKEYGSELRQLTEEYYWIPFLHVGPAMYDEKHYFNELKKLVFEHPELEKELHRAKTFYKDIETKQQQIIEKHHIDAETIRLLKDVHALSQMQDERKEYISRSHVLWTNNLMKRIGEFMEVDAIGAADAYPETIETYLLHDRKGKYIHPSRYPYIAIQDPEGFTFYYDDDAQQFVDIIESHTDDDILMGDCASSGKVTGRVKVLKNSDEIIKVERGDIMVTTMTTPDYVPAMRKAAAIVTDEGGVTCHAAIVSREFGLPCIINTKKATKILKDGEMIEVDATQGKITRLDRVQK